MNTPSTHPVPGSRRTSANRELTVRGEAGVAGVAERAAVGVGLVHGLIHDGCHPDGQVGGEGEHEPTPVSERWARRMKGP